MSSQYESNRWKRVDDWDDRPLRLDKFAVEDPENGFSAFNGKADPKPSIEVRDSKEEKATSRPSMVKLASESVAVAPLICCGWLAAGSGARGAGASASGAGWRTGASMDVSEQATKARAARAERNRHFIAKICTMIRNLCMSPEAIDALPEARSCFVTKLRGWQA